MNNLVFIDDPDNPYIHQVSKKLSNLTINEDYEFGDGDKVILSIDVGIVNLGLSVGFVDSEYKLKEIVWVNLIDITKYTHEVCLHEDTCTLHHTRCITDWLTHVFREHEPVFDRADYILIERQPPTGLVAVEQLIFREWRDKSVLVHPCSMHAHFDIKKYKYDRRKELTEKIASGVCRWNQRAKEIYEIFERKHDIADSICLMDFWLSEKHTEYINNKRRKFVMNTVLNESFNPQGETTESWFEQFRYHPRYTE